VSKIRANLKKQSQFASLWLEIRSTKLEIRNDLKKQSQFKANSPGFGRKLEALRKESLGRNPKSGTKTFFRKKFEKTKPIYDRLK